MSEAQTTPNPGSREAMRQGCKCPVLDNNYGRGNGQYNGETVFVFNEACPLHGGGDWRDR